ncbi:MAG: peptidoglycan DD-metalloendopeptidase family protein [Legionellales bacterium]|nr:peptidoglycan DD-metalloendopeptidase family protein [Legionellales bacterium]
MRQFCVVSLMTWFKKTIGCLLILSLIACANNRLAPMEHAAYRLHPNQAVATHQVQTGETLYAIAWRYDQDYRDLARYNGLVEPFAIRSGQTIYLTQQTPIKKPTSIKKTATSTAQKSVPRKPASASNKPATSSSQKTATASTKRAVPQSPTKSTSSVNASFTWQWPTQGEVIRTFAPSKGEKGIKITGRSGQAIKAAANGVVAYSGSGLRGYGQLLIIKHNQDYLSAYAHNRKLLVKEGDVVKAGQTIAEMGHSEATQVMLHFEIRKAGKPKDPLLYLRQIG